MSDDERGFLAKIIAEPAEDTHRLVFADWLDERGDRPRAEFVRVQVELARLDADGPVRTPLWDALSARERDLFLGWAGWWVRPLPVRGAVALSHPDCTVTCGVANPVVYTFRRGFVSTVRCAAADWLSRGDAVRAAHPVTRVTLTTAPDFEGVEDGFVLHGDPARAAFAPDAVSAKCDAVSPGAPYGLRVVTGLLHLRWPGVAFDLPG